MVVGSPHGQPTCLLSNRIRKFAHCIIKLMKGLYLLDFGGKVGRKSPARIAAFCFFGFLTLRLLDCTVSWKKRIVLFSWVEAVAGELPLVVCNSFVVVYSSSECLQMPDNDRRGGKGVRGGHVHRFFVHRRKYLNALLLPPSPLQLMQCCMHR